MKLETAQLPNGLRLAAAKVKGTSFLDLAFAVRVGSRYEAAVQNGISHFTEHLLFRGSRKYPSSYLLNHALESLGDGLEAGTARESTLFSITLPPENLAKVLSILADLFTEPLLDGIDVEKGIVSEEILEELDENGEEDDAENISRRAMFGEHPLGQPVLGRPPMLDSLSRHDVELHFREFFQPDNMVIAAAGDVVPGEFFEAVAEAFGGMKTRVPDEKPVLRDDEPKDAGTRYPELVPAAPGASGLPCGKNGPVAIFRVKPASQLAVLLSFVADGESSPDYVAQMALERILDDGISSRLQRSLCERKGLLYDVNASLEGYTDIGIFDFTFRIVEERGRIALREIFRELRTLKTEPVDDQELEKIRGRMLRESRQLFESSRFLAARTAETILLGHLTPLTLKEWRDRIGEFTAADIQAAARKIFVPQRLVAVIEGQLPEVDRGDIAQIFEIGLTQGF